MTTRGGNNHYKKSHKSLYILSLQQRAVTIITRNHTNPYIFYYSWHNRGRRGRDRGFTTTYAINAYHH